MKNYYELLQDPRWQKKRLEVMSENGFKCEECGSENKKLNVHHGFYWEGLAPWVYRNENYHCLCDACHQLIHIDYKVLQVITGVLDIKQIDKVIKYSKKLSGIKNWPIEELKTALLKEGYKNGRGEDVKESNINKQKASKPKK